MGSGEIEKVSRGETGHFFVVESATEAELLDQRPVFLNVFALQVFQEAFAFTNHHQQAATGGVIFFEFVEML